MDRMNAEPKEKAESNQNQSWAEELGGIFTNAGTRTTRFLPTGHHWTLCPSSNPSPEETTVMLSVLLPQAHPAPALQDKCCWISRNYTHQRGKGAVCCCTPFQGNKSIPHQWLLHTVTEKSTGILLTFTGHTGCKCCFPPTQIIPRVPIWCRKNVTRLYAIVSASESGVTYEK